MNAPPPSPTRAPPAATPSVSRAARASEVRGVLARVLVLNLIVVAIKVMVGVRTEALSVLGAALESSLDVLNNVVGMVLVTIAARGPDETHPYGHAKLRRRPSVAVAFSGYSIGPRGQPDRPHLGRQRPDRRVRAPARTTAWDCSTPC